MEVRLQSMFHVFLQKRLMIYLHRVVLSENSFMWTEGCRSTEEDSSRCTGSGYKQSTRKSKTKHTNTFDNIFLHTIILLYTFNNAMLQISSKGKGGREGGVFCHRQWGVQNESSGAWQLWWQVAGGTVLANVSHKLYNPQRQLGPPSTMQHDHN